MTTDVTSLRVLGIHRRLLTLWFLMMCRYTKQSIIAHLFFYQDLPQVVKQVVKSRQRDDSNKICDSAMWCSRFRFNDSSCVYEVLYSSCVFKALVQNTAWALVTKLWGKQLGIFKLGYIGWNTDLQCARMVSKHGEKDRYWSIVRVKGVGMKVLQITKNTCCSLVTS